MNPDTFYPFKSYPYSSIQIGDEIEIKSKDGQTITIDIIFGIYRSSAITIAGTRVC